MPAPLNGDWVHAQGVSSKQYTCGHCDSVVGSASGWIFKDPYGQVDVRIYICPYCKRPTFFENGSQQPGVSFGNNVTGISEEVQKLYEEARRSTKIGAHTATVLACRKLLMHTAVDKGADPGKSFLEYIEYLSQKGYITPDAKGWVDLIRIKGNEANHEIKLMDQNDAQNLITLVEMLLKIIYEFPGRVPKPPAGAGASA